ncbi:MAG: DUF3179 domain-containing protein [Roseovarius sp.]|nr:DUF3179 domain-containing protein [Roseovarius sp.]
MSRLIAPVLAFLLAFLLAQPMAQADPARWRSEWPQTDFARTTVPDWSEIRSGGPPRDGIPAIDAPEFLPAAAETRIDGAEPVMVLEIEGEIPRAYPIRYLMWHEIVNDVVGGLPVAVTYCPLCNSALSFDRRVQGRVLSFGVSGKLRHSDMVMYDRQTESWWQQALGEGIVGQMTGVRLAMLPGWMESWDQFRARNPEGLVMAEPAFNRYYGHNPYPGYDSSRRPFLHDGEDPPHGIPPLERVVRVGDRAWPLTRIRREGGISEAGVRITWEAGQASALDEGLIARGRDVGTVRVRDEQGRDVAHDVMFAFAYHAFWPEGRWMVR